MVNEFGHIIALIILAIFSFTLIFGIVQTRGNPAAMRETLQTIVSNLGGLGGAVIGYYFNSAVKDGRLSTAGTSASICQDGSTAKPEKDSARSLLV
jgi:hypothetical protein